MNRIKRMNKVHFWNGNKSSSRQLYETALLQACLNVTNEQYFTVDLKIDNTDYPLAEDEANVFATGVDILVTVAGNVKFKNKEKIVISQPLSKGVLGHRLLIVRDDALESFAQLTQCAELQALTVGIPDTWADAALFRHNHFQVNEQGSLEDLFVRLKNGEFDYVALGVNEIEAIFNQHALKLNGLSIEPSLMLYYPFPIQFYVNANNPDLAKRVQEGLNFLMLNGQYEALFSRFYAGLRQDFSLKDRRLFTLANPALPNDMANFSASFIE